MAKGPGRREIEHWGSRIGVILAVAGSAVGLGNFLRFPGLAAKYGGGAFMIPYFISLLLIGIPICWCEWTLGRYGGRKGHNSTPGIFRLILSKRWGHYIGVVALLIPLVIYMYYVYIESWCLSYAWQYATGEILHQKTVSVAQPPEGRLPREGLPGIWMDEHVNRIYARGQVQPETVAAILAAYPQVSVDPPPRTGPPGEGAVSPDAEGLIRTLSVAVPAGIPFSPTDGIRTDAEAGRLFVQADRTGLLVSALRTETPFALDDSLAAPVKRLLMVDALISLADLSTSNSAYGSHFESQVGMWRDGLGATPGSQRTILILLLVFILNFFLIYRGLNKGIELFCKIAMPTLILLALIVLVRVLTLGAPDPHKPEWNVNAGLGFMWNIDANSLQQLKNPNMWLEAAGQVFFSLSVGFALILTYSSYVRSRDDVVLSGLTSSSTNEFCEVCLAGLITIPAAFVFLGPEPIKAVAGSTLGLGFYTLPAVFGHMGEILGRLFGFLWFFLLFLAAVTSSISMLQPPIAFLEEGFNINRKTSVAVLGLLTAFGTLVVAYFSHDLMALDIMDFWVGQVCIFVVATILVIAFGWVFGVDRGFDEAHRGAHIRIPGIFKFIIKYVSPVYLITIFGFFLYVNLFPDDRASSYIWKVVDNLSARWTVGFLLVLVAFLTLLISLAARNWSRQEDAGGRE